MINSLPSLRSQEKFSILKLDTLTTLHSSLLKVNEPSSPYKQLNFIQVTENATFYRETTLKEELIIKEPSS